MHVPRLVSRVLSAAQVCTVNAQICEPIDGQLAAASAGSYYRLQLLHEAGALAFSKTALGDGA